MNTKHIDGIAVVSVNAGEQLGRVIDLLLDAEGRAVTAVMIQSGGGGLLAIDPPEVSWLAAEAIRAIGPDALTVEDAASLREFPPEAESIQVGRLLKRTVMTESGVAVGPVASLELDEQRMAVTEIEISMGFFKSNRMVSVDHLKSVGPEFIVVHDAVCAPESEDERLDAGMQDAEERARIVGDVEPTSTASS